LKDRVSERGEKEEGLTPLQGEPLRENPLDALQGGSSDVTRTEPFWVNPAS